MRHDMITRRYRLRERPGSAGTGRKLELRKIFRKLKERRISSCDQANALSMHVDR